MCKDYSSHQGDMVNQAVPHPYKKTRQWIKKTEQQTSNNTTENQKFKTDMKGDTQKTLQMML